MLNHFGLGGPSDDFFYAMVHLQIAGCVARTLNQHLNNNRQSIGG